jgi:Zn finger protein HypA/HybF involved in hydrogenase expression
MALDEILFSLVNKEIRKFVCTYESFSNHFFFDPPIDRTIRVTQADLLNALEVLENYKYVTSEETLTTYCVECFSISLYLVGKCPRCGSEKIRKGSRISHSCGYEGAREKFGTAVIMICPSCNKKLYESNADYREEKIKYSCVSCNSIFSDYMTFYKCPQCGASYKDGEEPSVSIRVFTPSSKLENERHRLLELYSSIDFLADLLTRLGFEVSKKAVIETKLRETFIDVFGYSQSNKRRLGISVSSNVYFRVHI